ncbi:VRR-NUC domain-containing protein [Corynebacterium rouxii]|uniref:VRR-NUC domain-containing protein n=1 Tax=Corynebacterium rouxii TaxID=2719119 RepID=A0ABU3PNB9_9CORY|nr:VRR-NUC domain-containing protein [Corynebacterium rouxii]MDT9411325.1 VRR-NUC domain-containing protein [Corynebacterium rouxii]
MLEKTIEKTLKTTIEKHGGICWKLTSPGTAGVPDRLIILPGGHICFIELKAPGQKPRPLQTHRHQQLTNLGAMVRTIDHPNQINNLIKEIHQWPTPTQQP